MARLLAEVQRAEDPARLSAKHEVITQPAYFSSGLRQAGSAHLLTLKFAEHIGVSDNQLPFGVLESVFFSVFQAMAGLLGEPWDPES